MRAFAHRPAATHATPRAKSAMFRRAGSGSAVNAILHLQRTIGNQAVQRRVQVQTKGAQPHIQLAKLRDFAGPQRQAFIIDDADIEATDEFKAYMNPGLAWQTQHKMTKAEAFLACRLFIEAIQRKEAVTWAKDARRFMDRARKLIKITKSPKKDCPSSKLKACVERADIPKELTNLSASPGLLIGSFRMEIDWHENEPDCACCCGEYRQFVRGFIKVNGRKQAKKLFDGKMLSETVFNEDADAANHPYGHRDLAEDTNDKFIPDRKNGCLYRGFDDPGIPDPAVGGKIVEIALEFKGQAFDRCRNTAGLEKQWKMDFKGEVPGLDEGEGAVG